MNPDYVPSLNLGYNLPSCDPKSKLKRHDRAKSRETKRRVEGKVEERILAVSMEAQCSINNNMTVQCSMNKNMLVQSVMNNNLDLQDSIDNTAGACSLDVDADEELLPEKACDEGNFPHT